MENFGGYVKFEEKCLARKYFTLKNNTQFEFALARHGLKFFLQNIKFNCLHIPAFTCDSIHIILKSFLNQHKLNVYHIDENFMPIISKLKKNDFILINNYFGLTAKKIIEYSKKINFQNIIVDNSQSIYDLEILKNYVQICSPRKFLPLTDGGLLYVPKKFYRNSFQKKFNKLNVDKSFHRTAWLYRGLDQQLTDYYKEYVNFRKNLQKTKFSKMSKTTVYLLNEINLENFKDKLNRAWSFICSNFSHDKKFIVKKSSPGLIFPLDTKYLNLRSKFKLKNIFIPNYWRHLKKGNLSKFEYNLLSEQLFIPQYWLNIKKLTKIINKILY